MKRGRGFMQGHVAKFVSAKAVGSFVAKLTKQAFERYGFSLATLLTEWPEIAGADIAASSVPDRLVWPQGAPRRGAGGEWERRQAATLYLRVAPSRALNVEYGQRAIVERINGYLGYRAVADLKVIQAPDLCGHAVDVPHSRHQAAALPSLPAEVYAVREAEVRDALTRLYASIALKAWAEPGDVHAALPQHRPAAAVALSHLQTADDGVRQSRPRRSNGRHTGQYESSQTPKRAAKGTRAKAVAHAKELS